ncbi:MAG: hypothetical protein FWD19_02605 [Defluviitaleaceae bacterium]|nr:hypothetical protein [Defluviitaleaceae bacterium]
MKKIRTAALAVLTFAMSIIGTITAFATTPPAAFDTAEIMGGVMTTVVGDIMGVVFVVVPIAMGLVGTIIAIKFGIKFIRRLVS